MTNRLNKRLRIGLLVGALLKEQPLFRGAAAAARDHGVDLYCFIGKNLNWKVDFAYQGNVLYDLVDVDRFDGLITWAGKGVALGQIANEQEMNNFFARFASLPIVNYEKTIPGLHSVRTDTAQAMSEILRHLFDVHERRRILLLRGPQDHFETEERVRAYRETLVNHGVGVDERLMLPAFPWAGPKDELFARFLDESGLEPGLDFDSVAGTEPYLACAAIRVLQARGVNIPQDVAVVGFNESHESLATHPPLTTCEKPFFASGYRAVEMLLEIISGKELPEEILLPARMIIRSSCGCLSPSILEIQESHTAGREEKPVHIDSGADRLSQTGLELPVDFEFEMHQAAGPAAAYLPPLWMTGLWKSFIWDLEGKTQYSFINSLTQLMINNAAEGRSADWNRLLTKFRAIIQPHVASSQSSAAETLLQQARLTIHDFINQEQSRLVVDSDRSFEVLNTIGVALNSALDFDTLLERIAAYLPRLNIPSCYLSKYMDPSNPSGLARLVMAYRDNQRIPLDEDGLVYPARLLVPEDLLPEVSNPLVIEPLYFHERQLGFVLFERAACDEIIYEYLQQQISSAFDRILIGRAIQESEQRYHALVDNLREIILVHRAGNLLFANRAARMYLETSGSENSLLERVLEKTAWTEAQATASGPDELRESDYEIDIPDGSGASRRMIVRSQEITYSHTPAEQIILVDITERKRMEDHLFFMSTRDTLTGLYNRSFFEQEMNRMKTARTETVSILVMDVDGLKTVNDSLGHAAGDELLRLAASALRSAFRGEDTLSRIGGDEFAAILHDMDETGMRRAVERVQRHLEEINQEGHEFQVRLSIGGCTARVGASLDEAFRLADQEMYRQKALTRFRAG